jgi:hypothetical protein
MGEERCMYKGECGCKRLDFKKDDYFCTLSRKEGCNQRESNYKRIQGIIELFALNNSHNGRIDKVLKNSYFSRISHFLKRKK